MGWLIVAVIAIVILYYVVVYIIAPLSGILLVVSLVIGVGYAFFMSVYRFFKSLVENINPYHTYVDKKVGAPTGVKRNYFFGPGYHQISSTVKDAFSGLKEQGDLLGEFRDKHSSRKWYVNVWIWIFYIAAFISIFVFGIAWMTFFSAFLASVIFVGMSLFYVWFTLLWVMDRLILTFKSIHSRCANCKRISVVPVFQCPNCGTEHDKLTPGPYGIFYRKCACNKKLPATFINGRSRLEAKCPFCATDIAASNAKQFGIQLVGGVSTGKTTFLAAFWHMYLENIRKQKKVSYDLFPDEAFNELEHWFKQGLSSSTTETNANMYSVVHRVKKETPYQLTIYDIAGEAFTDLSNSIQQQQFRYCEGLIFVIDPTTTPKNVSETFSSFITEFRGLHGKHSSKTSDIPVAVIISKADLYKKEIGLPKITARYKQRPNEFADANTQGSLNLTRNGASREFLDSHGYGSVLNLLEGDFTHVQYYPVSAMGHTAAVGQPYEPWGVLEPVMWLLTHTGSYLVDNVSLRQEVSV